MNLNYLKTYGYNNSINFLLTITTKLINMIYHYNNFKKQSLNNKEIFQSLYHLFMNMIKIIVMIKKQKKYT